MRKFLLELLVKWLGVLLPKLLKAPTAEDASGPGETEESLRADLKEQGWTDED